MHASGNNLPNNIVLDKEITDPTLKTAQPVVMLHRPGRSVPTAGPGGVSARTVALNPNHLPFSCELGNKFYPSCT